MRSPSWLFGTVLGAAALALAACGGDAGGGGGGQPAQQQGGDSSGGQRGGQAIELSADPGGALKFDKTELKSSAGKVTIQFDNPSSLPHAVEVEGEGVEEETKTVTSGKASLKLELKAGEYEFYCPVGNHQDQGMEGTLTVR